MALFLFDIELRVGQKMIVEETGRTVINKFGQKAVIAWEILAIRQRKSGDDFLDMVSMKTCSIKAIMRKKRLQKRKLSGQLLNIPASTDYLVIREYQDRYPVGLRCISLDMLGLIEKVHLLK